MAPMLNQKRCIWIEGMNSEHAPRFACRREDAWITHPRGTLTTGGTKAVPEQSNGRCLGPSQT